MATIKPFARPGFTMFNNYILDHIMPDLSASSWKVLCVAIRQTIGWQDEEAESGRREMEVISYSRFRQMTGIGSDQTVARAIKECVDKGYMLRVPGEGQEISYGLNMDYEIEIDTTSTEILEVGDEGTSLRQAQDTATEFVEVGENTSTETVEVVKSTSTVSVEVGRGSSTEIVEDPSTESVDTKENINKALTAKERMVSPLLERNIWQAALGELRLQMTKATFDAWVRNTRLLSCQDDIFVIGAQNEFARDWLENRLLTIVERTLVGIVGHPVEVRFVAES
jgi:hypothetical protein